MESQLASPHSKASGQRVLPLKVHRVAAGLKQAELAALAGIAPETISNLERGIFGPSRRTAKALAAALDVDERTLFPESANG